MKKTPIFLIILFFLVILVPQLCAQSSRAQVSTEEAAALRKEFIDYSKQFIGRPYLSGGIGPDSFDCSGLVFTCSRESIGVQLPRKTSAMFAFCTAVEDDEREAGDLVFFKTTASGTVSHVGIYIGNNQFIHAASDGPNTGVIISSLRENYWKTHYFKSARFLPSGKSAEKKTADANSVTESRVVQSPASRAESSAGASKKNAAAASSREDAAGARPFLSSIIFDGSFFADWNFFTAKNVRLNFRGASTMLHARYAGKNLQPGVGFLLRFDSGTGVFQIPLIASLSFGEYVRIFAGPVITAGEPTLPGDHNTDIAASFFPGIIGVCWQSPSIAAGKTKISIAQDIHYTVFNDTNGAALSPLKSIGSGLVFSSGVRVTLPLRNLL